ncbi:MAG TPA: hypothetical protein VFV67_09690 [Actinophytocola sp.]|uniref:hypothetical protein n=1 Tax=Actinophytocola sp. TaxID=1872138 RepID=UPI002DB637AA|nr:hypothetical protein [Actinophytocola sp.]HEU5470911.1 hypothetical protein [Actinophytocola sp.]
MTTSEHRVRIRRVVHPDVPGPIGPRPTPRERLAYSIRIRRIEYLPVELAGCAVAALLSVRSGSEPWSATAGVVAVLAALCCMHVVSMANALAGRDIDASPLSDAVYELGPRAVRRQIGATGVVLAGLAGCLAAGTGHWDILALVAVTLYLGTRYATGPLRLRGAGGWQIPALFLIRFWLPMVLIVRAQPGEPDWTVLLAIAGFAGCQVGIMLVGIARNRKPARGAGAAG